MPTLADASLDAAERRAVEHFVQRLHTELGQDLVAVWLYGSRARGDRHDPDSDVDLLVITRGGAPDGSLVSRLAVEAELAEEAPVDLMPHVWDVKHLAERRRIRSFFVGEVDRDKIVVFGDRLGTDDTFPVRGGENGDVSRRTQELIEQAREQLDAARDLLDTDHPGAAVPAAYYAMLYGARAALSNEDRHAKTHDGVWNLFSELFVRPDRFPKDLFDATKRARRYREGADYEALQIDAVLARELVGAAESFVDAIGEALAG